MYVWIKIVIFLRLIVQPYFPMINSWQMNETKQRTVRWFVFSILNNPNCHVCKHHHKTSEFCNWIMTLLIPIIKNINDKLCLFSQTHPNVDKKLFTAESVIGLKNPEKSFPLNNDVGVLKWRLQTTDESLIPLTSKCRRALVLLQFDETLHQYDWCYDCVVPSTVNCWPSESGTGCDVNIEYELQEESLELNDVVISIPVP